jgi:hypothetical protein
MPNEKSRRGEFASQYTSKRNVHFCVLAYVSVLSTRMLRIYIYAYNSSLASEGKFSFKKKKKKNTPCFIDN